MASKTRKRETFSPYDSADYLKTEEDMAEYLAACLDEAGDDPAFIAAALGTIARARGMSQLAKDIGGDMSFEAFLKVLKTLGLKLAVKVG